jgi:hypothetical protein
LDAIEWWRNGEIDKLIQILHGGCAHHPGALRLCFG